MSYSDQREKYADLGQTNGISKLELAFLKQESTISINEDHAVELLVDELRRVLSKFRFKEPLGDAFEAARDAALNCLENRNPLPRRVKHWVSDCLKCTDCILLVYIRDVLKQAIPIAEEKKWAQERDVYNAYLALKDPNLRKVGAIHGRIYGVRSRMDHVQIVNEKGRRCIQRVSNKELNEKYNVVCKDFKESLDIIVDRYREAYPQHRTDNN